jgi:type IV pilus assembly protein PilA
MIRKIAKGFTLIELMIVVAIIGILAAIAIPNFVKFQCRSKQGEARTNLKGIYVAEDAYRGRNGIYISLTNAEATASTPNELGFNVQGKIRYSYVVAGVTPGSAPTYTSTATGRAAIDMEGDSWSINQANILLPGEASTFCN